MNSIAGRLWSSFRSLPLAWQFTVAILSLSTVAFLVAWSIELIPYAPAWGTVADWVTALATVGALATIFIQVAQWRADQHSDQQRKLAREAESLEMQNREREALATSVGAEFTEALDADLGAPAVTWEIRNASSYPILNVRLMSKSHGLVHKLGTVLPLSDRKGKHRVPGGSADELHEDSEFYVEYEDIWGNVRKSPSR